MMSGSGDDSDKLESSSSAREPLLFLSNSNQESPNHYLQISYNDGPRPFKDIPFLILFLFFLLSTFAFGIFALFHRNAHYSSLSSYSYDSNSTSCVNQSPSSLSLLPSSSSSLLTWTLLLTFILSLPICWALLLLLKHYAKQIIYASLPFFLIIPIFFDVYWFVACALSSSCTHAFPLAYRILVLLFIFFIIGVLLWILVANWHRVELTVNIIGVASNALSWNLGLFGVLPCLTIGLLLLCAPIVVFLVFARFNGKIVPHNSDGEYSCVWKQDSWVPAYFALAILTMLWSASAMLEAQVYVISATIAQWYFSMDHLPPPRTIRSSLRFSAPSTSLLLHSR